MEQVCISSLDQLLLGREFDLEEDYRDWVTGRGYLLVCDEESVRDSAVRFLKNIVNFRYLDVNAEPQGKKISEMCIAACGTSYQLQKDRAFDFEPSYWLREYKGFALVVDNFQDIGLLANREVKLALAFLRSLGRSPYKMAVIGVGSKEALDVIDLDLQLKRSWKICEIVADSPEET